MELERFVDLNQETLAEYATAADVYHRYYCIIPLGSHNVNSALEETLHCLIENGASDEEIYSIMGAEQVDLSQVKEEELEDYISIDLGYYICGQLTIFQSLEQIKEYRKYCMLWYAEHEISLEGIFEEIDADDSDGLYIRMADYADACIGKSPMDFISFCESCKSKKSPKSISINTKVGTIKAFELQDDEYPGMALVLESQNGGEPGAVMEYNPEKCSIDLKVYGMADPEGDPIETYAMSM